MERIIIREVDNTSNVETLSTYDVVYVPGFSTQAADASLYRNPTLITSKYQFLRTFGGNNNSDTTSSTIPRFPVKQEWPVATESSNGFPTWAIPNYTNTKIDNTPLNLSSFSDMDEVESFYTHVSITSEEEGEDWVKDPNLNYFELTGTSSTGYTMSYSNLPLDPGQTYIEKYGPQALDNVYISAASPIDNDWYEASGTGYIRSSDTQISVASNTTTIKQYFQSESTTPVMFESNEPDPGYRYALYLLSLGIPVYFEQMNSVEFEEVDIVSDWESSLVKYGKSVESQGSTVTYINPAENGWYYYDGTTYKRWEDYTSPQYTSADAVDQVWYSGSDISVQSLYEGLEKRFMSDSSEPDYSFDCMGDYSIKYISTGGYPTFEYGTAETNSSGRTVVKSGLAEAMMTLAQKRSDCVALIDHTNNPDRTIYEAEELSVIYQVREQFADLDEKIASHGAMFTPWYSCTHAVIAGETGATYPNAFMPASLAFLSSLANQLRNYNPWLAVSGVTRGKVPFFGSLHTNQPLTNNVADSYQSVPSDEVSDYALISINPITYIRQYGYCIWGNRTLRNLVSDIKKRLYEASQRLLFEQNTEILWINFKRLVTPLLDTMVSNNILSEYRMTKYNVDPESGEAVPAYKVLANIMIRPINSVEVFDLTIQLENNEISVTETE